MESKTNPEIDFCNELDLLPESLIKDLNISESSINCDDVDTVDESNKLRSSQTIDQFFFLNSKSNSLPEIPNKRKGTSGPLNFSDLFPINELNDENFILNKNAFFLNSQSSQFLTTKPFTNQNENIDNFDLIPNRKSNNTLDRSLYGSNTNLGFNQRVVDPSKKVYSEKTLNINNGLFQMLSHNPVVPQRKRTDYLHTHYNHETLQIQHFLNNIGESLSSYICTLRGSKEMQKLLNSNTEPQIYDLMINKIKKDFYSIMTNQYGNYFSQKLIRICTVKQRLIILKNIMPHFKLIAFNNYGTHVIQTFIEIIQSMDEANILINCIYKDLVELSINSNSTHIVQKIMLAVHEYNRQLLNFQIINNLYTLCRETNGVCVIKKFIKDNKCLLIRNSVIEIIAKNFVEIAQNNFGNYAIQFIFETWHSNQLGPFINAIINNVILLSSHKFSSNVVEKALDHLDEKSRENLIREMFYQNKVITLTKNKYGVFVLQKAIGLMTSVQKTKTYESLKKKSKREENTEIENQRYYEILNLFDNHR